MHKFVEEELTRLSRTGETESGSGSSSRNGHEERQGLLEERWRTALRKSFERMDEVALSTCTCGRVGYKCRCHPVELALGGSTAVVALLSPERIVVANCGDSRAVLCRAGTAIPLSQDHKVGHLSVLLQPIIEYVEKKMQSLSMSDTWFVAILGTEKFL